MNTETVELAQGPIRYRDGGSGEPILFVHGLLVDGRLWGRVPELLAGSHRCIVPDLPMGSHVAAMAPDADLSPPGLADLIAEFIGALGVERVTVVGNDTGGAMSQILAANHPERVSRLVLTNCDTLEHFPPFPFNALPPIARLPGAFAALGLPFRLGPVRRAAFAPLAKHPIDPALADAWLEPLGEDREIRRDARKVTAGLDKRHTIAAADRLRDIGTPVRFAWGTDDGFFKLAHAERLAAMLPDARIEHVADAKTFVSLDQPARVAELVAEFAREPLASAST
jgi:pimeloyl-ACP methyl ester carboxylesterase